MEHVGVWVPIRQKDELRTVLQMPEYYINDFLKPGGNYTYEHHYPTDLKKTHYQVIKGDLCLW